MTSLKTLLLRTFAVRANVQYAKDLHVGPGSVVWAPRELKIGKRVYIGKNVTIEVDGEIGDEVLIANSVGIVGRLDHDPYSIGAPIRSAAWVGDEPDRLSVPVRIGSDVWIGFGAVVLSGVTVGSCSVIAAGSVVTSDVPPNSIVAGAPARVVKCRFGPEEYQRHLEILTAKGIRMDLDEAA